MMKKSDYEELTLKIEALIFAYADWLGPQEIMTTLAIDSQKLVDNAVEDIQKKYSGDNYAFHLQKGDDGKYKFTVKEQYEIYISDLVSGVEIPKPILKVLSVIAYEQPITKTGLNKVLGRSVKPEVDYLFKAKFISYEKIKNARYYKVTKKFFDYFKIENEEEFRKKANEKMQQILKESQEGSLKPHLTSTPAEETSTAKDSSDE